MADFVFSGGCRWDNLCAVDVTMDPATGDPLSCKNPITGAEISGGGGDLALIDLSFVNNTGDVVATYYASIDGDGQIFFEEQIQDGSSTAEAIAVNGACHIYINVDFAKVSVSGDATTDAENQEVIATGACTITISA